jgi:RNA polymerase sigma-70 factor (ECF subfamily)
MLRAIQTHEELLDRARAGDRDAFGELLKRCHNDIRILAQSLIGTTLKMRLDPSDLVQEAYLEAHRDFPRFTGSTETELLAWLRRILARNVIDNARHQTAGIRNRRRQVSLEALLEQSNPAVHAALATKGASPSAAAVMGERAVRLAQALAGLPPDYREVIVLRNLEGLQFQEVAARMGRSPGAVRMLWARAIERLSEAVEGLS